MNWISKKLNKFEHEIYMKSSLFVSWISTPNRNKIKSTNLKLLILGSNLTYLEHYHGLCIFTFRQKFSHTHPKTLVLTALSQKKEEAKSLETKSKMKGNVLQVNEQLIRPTTQ